MTTTKRMRDGKPAVMIVEQFLRVKNLQLFFDEMPLDFGDTHLLRLDEALEKLAIENPTQSQLIELRFFGGLTIEQACEILKISRATASRYWNHARA